MSARTHVVSALRALLARILSDPGVVADCLAEVEALAESGGNGRLLIIVDFKDARRAYCSKLSIVQVGKTPLQTRSFDIAEEARTQ